MGSAVRMGRDTAAGYCNYNSSATSPLPAKQQHFGPSKMIAVVDGAIEQHRDRPKISVVPVDNSACDG